MAPARPGALPHLKRRAEFLRVAGGGRKWVAPGLILQVLRREPMPVTPSVDAARSSRATGEEIGDLVRIGFTASRKVGIAVARNRARRRLRAAVAEIMPGHAAPDHDYVLVARAATLTRPYSALLEDLKTGLRRLGVFREAEACGGAARSE